MGNEILVTVKNHGESYALRGREKRPDRYRFSIEPERFDREAEINKLMEEIGKRNVLIMEALASSRAVTKLLIEI